MKKPAAGRKVYKTPRLVVYGTLRDLTQSSAGGMGRLDDGSNCQGTCAGKRT